MPEVSFEDLEDFEKTTGMKRPKNKFLKYDWPKVLKKIKAINLKEKRPVIPSEVRKIAKTKHPNETYQWLQRHTKTNERPDGELICVKSDDGRLFYAHEDAVRELTAKRKTKAE